MSKLSHSHQPTMDAIDAQRAKEDGIEAPTQHTPGPWHTGNGNCHGVYTEKFKGKQRLIAQCPTQEGDEDFDSAECLANARLIAAAPETVRERDVLYSHLEAEKKEHAITFDRAEKAEALRDELLAASKNVMTFYMGIIGGVTGDATRDALLNLQAAIASAEGR